VTVLKRTERAQSLDDRQLRRLAKFDEVRVAHIRSQEIAANAASRYSSQRDASLLTERTQRPATSILQRSSPELCGASSGRGVDRFWRHLQL